MAPAGVIVAGPATARWIIASRHDRSPRGLAPWSPMPALVSLTTNGLGGTPQRHLAVVGWGRCCSQAGAGVSIGPSLIPSTG